MTAHLYPGFIFNYQYPFFSECHIFAEDKTNFSTHLRYFYHKTFLVSNVPLHHASKLHGNFAEITKISSK